MGLATPELINLWGVIVTGVFAFFNICLAIVIFFYAKRKDKVKGPRLAIFDYKEEKIRSGYTEEGDFLVTDKFPKPKWFINIEYEVLNTGDLTSKFNYCATLTLHDILDKQTKEPMKTKSSSTVVEIFKPGEWKELHKNYHIREFGFVFDDIEAHKWEYATVEIIGHFYDKKSKRQPIQIEPRKLKNPQHLQKLSKAVEDKIRAYNEQKLKLNS